MDEQKREREREEIVSLLKEAGTPKRRRPSRAKLPGIAINGDHNIIALGAIRITRPAGWRDLVPRDEESKSRRRKAPSWRTELEDQIWHRIWDLSLTAEQFFELASKKLGKHISAMASMNERDLGIAYQMVATLKRPAVER